MLKKLFIIFILVIISMSAVSCGAFQLKHDRQVQGHMETLLTAPDETVKSIIETWNAQKNLTPGTNVDLELIQKDITKLEFDNKKGHCRAFLKEGLDFETQRKAVGMTMVVFGSLYWQIPEQKRETIYVFGNIDEEEYYIFSWKRGDPQPLMDKDRSGNYV